MALNQSYWSFIFMDVYVSQLTAIVDVLQDRILTGFENIEEEAEKLSTEKWNEYMSSPGTGNEDPGDYAEHAEEVGISHFILLKQIRQGVINLHAVFLFHLFEQHIMTFFRKEILNPQEERDSELFNNQEFKKMQKKGNEPTFHSGMINFEEFKNRLKNIGVEIDNFESWSKISELRQVANAVKHAEGSSAGRLKNMRPDLFSNPELQNLEINNTLFNPKVYSPLSGEDIFLSLNDIHDYKDSIRSFYIELMSSIESL
ncbi:MAG: hypothetical protein JJU41_10770 [Bacteroidetes bacterium]|nr:hypothetical protein [Bacteroidota bacterium]MCH8525396.1 hypothetical protein [Balneolales bacterium]